MGYDRDLRSSLMLEWSEQPIEITPRLVADKLREALDSSKVTWIPEAILRHTVGNDYLRSEITHADVLKAYENALFRIVSGFGLEGAASPLTDLIVSHIAQDARLRSAISPDYIKNKYQQALEEGKIDEAFYLFQSTERNPDLRQKSFSPDDVANLFQEMREKDKMRLIAELLKTTQGDSCSRSQITSTMFADAFHQSVRLAETPKDSGHYALMAVWMLRHTVGDTQIRGGLDTEKLKKFYWSIWSGTYPKWEKEFAGRNFREIAAYTLQDPTTETVSSLFKSFNSIAADRGEVGPVRQAAWDAAQAMKRYPAFSTPSGATG